MLLDIFEKAVENDYVKGPQNLKFFKNVIIISHLMNLFSHCLLR